MCDFGKDALLQLQKVIQIQTEQNELPGKILEVVMGAYVSSKNTEPGKLREMAEKKATWFLKQWENNQEELRKINLEIEAMLTIP